MIHLRSVKFPRFLAVSCILGLVLVATATGFAAPRSVSGIYPHLAMFNDEDECGTGAVVPWAGGLWAVTYAPHKPTGSSDKLYEISERFEQVIRPESIGGTPANRMIHRESKQLFIGPYAIDEKRTVRTIPYSVMYGRPTGNARHLFDPTGKIYYATMEEGLYEVDVKTLAVKELWTDEQQKNGHYSKLPGYHGKGLYSGQGRLVYSNNGDQAKEAYSNPSVESGVLAEWDGRATNWNIVRRNQFTEVTGPGGIYGNAEDTDPIWTIGWDHRSLILQVLENGKWKSFRLPKGSHSYDGAHGWNTEWPRIRDVGEKDMLMTMHGTFWKFPKSFSATNSAGIKPRSNYLKVIGDFCRWNDRLVFGCDDTARSEFLNKRKAKGTIAGPGRSQSNLWFVEPHQLDALGPVIGRGAVWLKERVLAGVASEPYLFSTYDHRGLHLAHDSEHAATFVLEVDVNGTDEWKQMREIAVPAKGYVWIGFTPEEKGQWIRLRAKADCEGVTAWFTYRNKDKRSLKASSAFKGLGNGTPLEGLLHARGGGLNTLRVTPESGSGEVSYDLDGDLKLRKVLDRSGAEWMRTNLAIPRNVLTIDNASVLYVDDKGARWRLPKGSSDFLPRGDERISREVCTERDLFNAGGSFYELPAENAGGFAKIRPVATHNRHIKDYASYRGLLVMAGVDKDAPAGDHIIRSDDNEFAVWVGAVDDLWKLGKARGVGGPLNSTEVQANVPSDPFLMTGYDRKKVQLKHSSSENVWVRLEADLSGTGLWVTYRDFTIPAGETVGHQFPEAFSAYWVRVSCDKTTRATALFQYE